MNNLKKNKSREKKQVHGKKKELVNKFNFKKKKIEVREEEEEKNSLRTGTILV